MQESPGVALKLANTIEDLEVVAAVLTGVADGAGLDALARSDLLTASLEACKNVVWHAYEGVRGPLELEARLGEGLIEVVVRDHGIGIRPHLGERTLPHTGIGMPIAHLLTRRIIYTNMPGGGTEVRMEFSMPGVAGAGAGLESELLELHAGDEDEEAILLALAGGLTIGTVLPLALAALARRAEMAPPALERAEELALAALGVAADGGNLGSLALRAAVHPQGIDLAFSRLGASLAQELRERARGLAQDGALIVTVAEPERSGETLALRLRSAG